MFHVERTCRTKCSTWNIKVWLYCRAHKKHSTMCAGDQDGLAPLQRLLQGDLNGVSFSQPKNHSSTDGYHCAGPLNKLLVQSESAGRDVIKSRSCRQAIKTPAIYLD